MFRYPSGREVRAVGVKISPTYLGQLEGTPERLSDRILEELPKCVVREFGPGSPLVILDADERPLPEWIWIAEFESWTAVATRDTDYHSRLCVCWFTADIDRHLPSEIERVLARVDWESSAEDYDITLI
jgi:hypothetical protein